MTKHFIREIDKIKKRILELAALVEEAVYKAVKAVETRDEILSEKIKESDRIIDMMEVEIEEECLKVLALHQPVAIDLRFVVAVLKMNNDLERIGDLAVSISWRAKLLAALPPVSPPFDLEKMANKVKEMLRQSLQALVTLDPKLAREICASDDEVDIANRKIFQYTSERITEKPEANQNLIHYYTVARSLERIADHVTNIAEDVIYMVEGEIVRHGKGTL